MVLRLLALVLLLPCGLPLLAEESAGEGAQGDPPVAETPTGDPLAELQALRVQIADSQELDDVTRPKALGYLDRAIRFRQEKAQVVQENQRLESMLANGTERRAQLQAMADARSTRSATSADILQGMPAADLEQEMVGVQQRLSQLRQEERRWDDELNNVRTLLATATSQQETIAGRIRDLDRPNAVPGEPTPVARCRALQAAAERELLEARSHGIGILTSGQDLIIALLVAEKSRFTSAIRINERYRSRVSTERDRRRRMAAEEERQRTAAAAASAGLMPEILRQEYERNATLGGALQEVTAERTRLRELVEDRKRDYERMSAEFGIVRQRANAGTLTGGLGDEWSRKLKKLEEMDIRQEMAGNRKADVRRIRSEHAEVEARLEGLNDHFAIIRATLPPSLIAGDTQLDNFRELRRDQKSLLTELRNGWARCLDRIQDLESLDNQIARQRQDFVELLEEQLLWLRTEAPLPGVDPSLVNGAMATAFLPATWVPVFASLGRGLATLWYLPLVAVIAAAGLFFLGLRLLSVETKKWQVWSRLLACMAWAAMPMAIVFPIALALLVDPSSPYGGFGIARGIIPMSLLGAMATGCFMISRPSVAAVLVPGWTQAQLTALRHCGVFLLAAYLPVRLIFVVVHAQAADPVGNLAGRLWLVLVALLLAVALVLCSRCLVDTAKESTVGRIIRWTLALLPAATIITLVVIGFSYTATVLMIRLGPTVALCLVFTGLWHALIVREGNDDDADTTDEDIGNESEERVEAEIKADSTSLSSPARSAGSSPLLRNPWGGTTLILRAIRLIVMVGFLTGLSRIWVPVLPVLEDMFNIVLWTVGSDVDAVQLTLGDAVTSFAIFLLVLAGARVIPAFLDLLLRRTSLVDRGGRFIAAMVIRYGMLTAAPILVLNHLGVSWTSLQWLIAALGVGIGFGLQEIVANLVAGIVLIFERPFRVGDVVTVGQINGHVAHIGLRSTIITDLDRRDLVVPNRSFITGNLINWTLSDSVNRITLEVGIAYGSDVRQARLLMLKAARKNPRVLRDPRPMAWFMEFGDRALQLRLLMFVNSFDDRFVVISEVNHAIDEAFKEAGISIANPQRDLRVEGAVPVKVVEEQEEKPQ